MSSSSSDDELPEIPGTRFPWMEDVASSSSSSRSPRKLSKIPRISAVEKEKKTYKDPKKKPVKMDISSEDDDFVDSQPGPSTRNRPKQLSAAEVKRKKANDRLREWRAKRTEEKKQEDLRKRATNRKAQQTSEDRALDAQRKAAERANETPAEHQHRNQANAQRTAAAEEPIGCRETCSYTSQ